MSKEYPDDYLELCSKEMFAIINNNTDSAYNDALNYFKELYN